MNRRTFIATGAAASVGVMAGCLSDSVDVPQEDQINTLPTPTLGDSEADLRLQIFEDYMCPHCASFNVDHFPPLREEYIDPGHIAYEYYDFPLPVNSYSRPAANIARYVQDELGIDAFWEYKAYVYQNQGDASSDVLVDGAVDLGTDADEADYARHGVYDPVITADREYGDELGVQGTPWVFLNGDHIDNPAYPNLSGILDMRLDETHEA